MSIKNVLHCQSQDSFKVHKCVYIYIYGYIYIYMWKSKVLYLKYQSVLNSIAKRHTSSVICFLHIFM